MCVFDRSLWLQSFEHATLAHTTTGPKALWTGFVWFHSSLASEILL